MKAVILTGGKGTRLAPYTTVLPKPLLPIGDIPILLIILRQLKNYGFTEVILACGFLSELVQAYIMNNRISKELKIVFHQEEEPLGTAGALASIEGIRDEPFLVMNGDILTTLNYMKVVENHKATGAAITIAVTQKKVQVELGVLNMNEKNEVVDYDEKPTKYYPASMGIYIYDPRALKGVKQNQYLDAPTLFLNLIKEGEKVVGYPSEEFWLDMGNKTDYERAVIEFEDNKSRFNADH